MTPKEKARELVDKYIEEGICFVGDYSIEKSCAITAINEMTKYIPNIYHNDKTKKNYWNEVKKEINKL